MKKHTFITAFLFLFIGTWGQISPPGLGIAHTAEWFALGVRQDLDTIDGSGWQSLSYAGVGRKSNPDNFNPLYKPAILVFNQEFYHQFHKNWKYSLALSYRRQDAYLDNASYGHDNPALKQEFRVYSRLLYHFVMSGIKIEPAARAEFRKFYAPDFGNVSENFQCRARFRVKISSPIDSKNRHRLTAGSEQLFSISKKSAPNDWTAFGYRESRFMFYYSYSPGSLPVILSAGYMNNLVGTTDKYDVHYLAFDILVTNPFNPKNDYRLNTQDSPE